MPGITLDPSVGDALPGASAASQVPATPAAGSDAVLSMRRDFGARCDGVTDDTAAAQAALNAVPTAGAEVTWSGNMLVTSPLVVSKLGTRLRGQGHGSTLTVNHVGDAFQISASLARFENMEIQVGVATSRVGSAIWNVQAGGDRGRIRDVRVTANAGSTANGMVFREDTHQAGGWSIADLSISGGSYWTSIIRLSADATQGTCASHFVTGMLGTQVHVTTAAIDLEGAIDTLSFIGGGLDVVGGPFVWTHTPRPAEEYFYPRWVHFDSAFGEAWADAANPWTVGSTIPVVQIDSVRDFRWVNGYISSGSFGVQVGAKAQGVVIAFNDMTNLARSALTIAAGALDVTFQGNAIGDACAAAGNTYDTISVAANAAGFRILGNEFASIAANKARYHVGIAAGTSTDFAIRDNRFRVAAATANLSNGATGADWAISGNPGLDNYVHASTSNLFDGPGRFNSALTAVRLLTPASADRGDTSQTLTVGTDAQVQRWATTLTANRTVTLSTTGAANGDTFRVVRTGLGAFTLDVGGLKTIPSATAAFVDVVYNGSVWVLSGYGAL